MLMLYLILTIRNKPKIPVLFFVFPKPESLKSPDFFFSSQLSFHCWKKRNMSTKIVAEHAKSGRSSCKKCGEAITAQTLRLGLVSRDARGFDMTKWHHLNCFSGKIDSFDGIKGFDSLKDVDQEALKKLADGSIKPPKKLQGKEDEEIESEKSISKKIKLSAPDEKALLDIAFSVSNVKDKYKDATLQPKWKAFQTVIFLERDDGLHDSGKLLLLILMVVWLTHLLEGADAWSLMYPSIPEKLQSLYEESFKLVIFTNESNIDRWKNKRQVAVDSKIGRLNNFIKQVKVPMQVSIACGMGSSGSKADDPFRKPNPGMWHIMEKQFNSGIPIDMDQSFFVGDAAGRPNDHSDADIKFAQAIGLKFYVPEDYFST